MVKSVKADNDAKDAELAQKEMKIEGLKRKVVSLEEDFDVMLGSRKKRREIDDEEGRVASKHGYD